MEESELPARQQILDDPHMTHVAVVRSALEEYQIADAQIFPVLDFGNLLVLTRRAGAQPVAELLEYKRGEARTVERMRPPAGITIG